MVKVKTTVYAVLQLMLFSCSAHSKPEIRGDRNAKECVVLLHGLARTSGSMDTMEKALGRAGYKTVNIDYPSREKSIADIAAEELLTGVQLCNQAGAEKIHIVTHSMGGIIVRKAMNNEQPENLGRVVMLSPPNKGSHVTDKLKDWWFYQWLNGPAGQELRTEPGSLPNTLGPVDYQVGVITGNSYSFFDAWFATFIPGEHDGKVSVEGAKVEGMADFLVVPEGHSFIMNADRVINETILFLRQGAFSHIGDQTQN